MDMLIQQTPLAPDFIQEVKISYSGNKADTQGALVIDSPTRSGTNQLHAKVDQHLLNPALNSLGPNPSAVRSGGQTTTRSTYLQGAGPVYIPHVYDGRDKTFWWVGWQWAKQATPVRGRPSHFIPPFDWRNGDFSTVPSNLFTNASQTLIDPLTGQPFPGNRIPTDRFIPAAKFLNDVWPTPNFGGGIANPNNYTGLNWQSVSVPGGVFQDYAPKLQNFRGDHKLTDRDQIGYTLVRNHSVSGWNFDEMGLWVIDQYGSNAMHAGYWTHTFSPAVLNEFRFGHSRSTDGWGVPKGTNSVGMATIFNAGGFDALQKLGIPWKPTGVDPSSPADESLPTICISGVYSPMCATGGNEDQSSDDNRIVSFVDNLSMHRGNHGLKWGAEWAWKSSQELTTHPFGTFGYDGRFTGLPYADFLLGFPATSTIKSLPPTFLSKVRQQAFYMMDDWKLKSNLTLELGLRFENHSEPYEDNGYMVNFEPKTASLVVLDEDALSKVSPLFPKQIPVVTAAQAGYPDKLRTYHQHYFYPRVGIAWRPFDDAKTVVRAGLGHFASPMNWTMSLKSSSPFVLDQSFDNSVFNGQPLFTQDNPIPNVSGAVPGQSGFGVIKDAILPTSYSWNLTVEREIFPNTAVRIAYLGSKTSHQPYTVDLNKPQPGLLPYLSNCPSLPVGTCVGPNYTYFTSAVLAEYGGNINSHGMELELHHRFSGGLEFMVDYFWNRTLTDVGDSSDAHPKGYDYGDLIEDPNNRSRDRGISHFTVPHRFVVNHTWTLPFGKGMRWLNNNKPADLVVGGWTLMGWYAWQSRQWETPLWIGSDFTNTNTFNARPDVVPGCNPNVDPPTADKTFNSQCFVLPPTGRYGDAGKATVQNVPVGFWPNTSLFMSKSFNIANVLSESGLRFRIGARFDNPINHPVLQTIRQRFAAANVNVPGADQSSYTGTRSISFLLRLEF